MFILVFKIGFLKMSREHINSTYIKITLFSHASKKMAQKEKNMAGCGVEEQTKEMHNGQYNCIPVQATNVIVMTRVISP